MANVVLDGWLGALAEPTRRQVVELLRERPYRSGDLARAADTSPPAMSRHLRVLLESGWVRADRVDEDARVRIFRLRREPFLALQGWLDEAQTFWDGQLGSFRKHVGRNVREGR